MNIHYHDKLWMNREPCTRVFFLHTCAQLLLGWQNCYPWKELQAKCGNILDSLPETLSQTKKKHCSELQAKRKCVKFGGNTMSLRVHLCDTHTGVHSALLQVAGYFNLSICRAIIYHNIIILLIYQSRCDTPILLSSNAEWILILISVLILITFCACILVELDQFSCSPTATPNYLCCERTVTSSID